MQRPIWKREGGWGRDLSSQVEAQSRLRGLPRGPIYSAPKILPENKYLPPLHPSSFITLKMQQCFGKRLPPPTVTKASLYHPLTGIERACSQHWERPGVVGQALWVWSLALACSLPRTAVRGSWGSYPHPHKVSPEGRLFVEDKQFGNFDLSNIMGYNVALSST